MTWSALLHARYPIMTDASSFRSQLDQLPRPVKRTLGIIAAIVNPEEYMVVARNEQEYRTMRDYFNALPASDKTV